MTKRILRQLLIQGPLAAALLSAMTACSTPQSGDVDGTEMTGALQSSERVVSLAHFTFGDRSSSAWVSDSFEGTQSRQFRGERLHFEVEQYASDGGLDVGVSEIASKVQPVATAKTDLYVCSSYSIDLAGPGRWWAGPKISVNWQGEESAKQNGDDWYENYIVEVASSSPQDLHDLFTSDYFKAEELPPLELSGATYRNYKIRFHDWWQFWSVRQDYRDTGTLPIEPIVDVWIARGLPTDRAFDGVKANIETYGPINGQGRLFMETASDSADLSCEDEA
ncbi:MAG: hypothetical protein AAFP81_11160 [Pseudomonadota bacterium]